MSWKPEVFVDGQWSTNALRFATEEEAYLWARDLLLRWFAPSDSRAAESDDPVTHRRLEDGSTQEISTSQATEAQ